MTLLFESFATTWKLNGATACCRPIGSMSKWSGGGELARIVTVGCGDTGVTVPAPFERCLVVHVWTCAVAGALAPGPPPSLSPYVIVSSSPPFSVTPFTLMVAPETLTEPVEAVVNPAAVPTVDGADQVAGTTIEIAPFCIPPVAAV